MNQKVLVIEDDVDSGAIVRDTLERAGYAVTLCSDGEDGFFQAMTHSYDLLVLDVVLPRRSGLEILVGLRKLNHTMPVLMLSTRFDVADRVNALSLDADDYMGKPFALTELLARCRTLLRRSQAPAPLKLSVGDLQINLLSREVTRANRPLNLTQRECELLEYLMRHNGRVVSRAMLAQEVWKGVDRVTALDNVIDVHMSRLRRKLELPGRPELLHTVRGAGFRLAAEATAPGLSA